MVTWMLELELPWQARWVLVCPMVTWMLELELP
jgi:hypothetical protein